MIKKSRIIFVVVIILLIISGYIYVKYFFTYEQKNITQRKIESLQGRISLLQYSVLMGALLKDGPELKKLLHFRTREIILFFIQKKDAMFRSPIQSGI
jgi:hypothetical protein